jgi:hypothetical protein
LTATASNYVAQVTPGRRALQSIYLLDKVNQTRAVIAAIIMMDYCYRGFPQQSVEGKVFDPFPWVSPGKEWKV